MNRTIFKLLTSKNCTVSSFRSYVKRLPLDPDHEKLLPIFNYPTAKSSDRRVYGWGLVDTGALGVVVPSKLYADKKNTLHTARAPKRIQFSEYFNVLDIECGYGFTIFTVKNAGEYVLYGSGINTDSQMGYHAPRRGSPLEFLLTPFPINLNLKKGTKILQTSAGRAHVAVLTDNGVLTIGNNSYGQCGRRIVENEDYRNISIIHRIAKIKDENIRTVKAGQDHTMFITESGKVYACGWGADGQLGNGSYETSHKLNRIRGDIEGENIVKLSCAGDCILALSDKGEVFGWGNSEYGQLNIENKNDYQVNVSRCLNLSGMHGRIVDIAAGGSYCVVLNDKGELFTWGYGILGVGPNVTQSLKPIPIPTTLFYNEFNTGSKLVNLYTGLYHTAAIMSDGELFMWGKNKHGCLGFGHEKDQFFPLRTSVGAQVIKLSCGVDHTMALCKPFM